MNIIKGFIIAFSMFSKIPMPMVKWEEENMKYMFVFFPFIGIITGALLTIWFYICHKTGLSNIVFAAVASLIPVAVTGGIHIDGFMDTCDALSSHKDRDKMLDILSDSHIGAFAAISTILYFILYFGAMTCVDELWQIYMIMTAMFTLRAVAVVNIISTETAKETGLIYTFKKSANNIITGLFSAFFILISVGVIESFNILVGACVVIALFMITIYFNLSVVRKFKGITGDLIGWLISICELAAVLIVAVGGSL